MCSNDSFDMDINFNEENNLKQLWTREEDKQLLEVLKLSLIEATNTDQPVEEVINETYVHEVLSNTNKSLDAVRKRVKYLLHLLSLSNNT